MTNLFKFATDLEKEREGVWTPWLGDIELKVAAITSPEFEAYLRRVTSPIQHKIRSGDIDDEVLASISKEGVAKFLLRDWRNVEEPDGDGFVTVHYSWQKALEYFEDPRMKHFYRDVVQIASRQAQFRAADLEAREGN